MKKLLLTVILTVSFAGGAEAFPGLIVYVPDASFDFATSNWTTTATEFDIWIMSVHDISNLQLTASTEPGSSYSGSLALAGFGYSDADFISGSPSPFGRDPSGIDSYLTHDLGAISGFTLTSYHVSLTGVGDLTFDFWGYDEYGYLQNSYPGIVSYVGSFGTASVVPEPTTMALFGVGLAGVALRRRKKSRLNKAA